jgi:branched-chain amino acid transport system permease protein
MTELAQNLFNALVASGVYLLVAVGITVVFGLTRLINFAHGQLLVVAAFVASTVTSHGGGFFLGLIAGIAIASALAFLFERAAFRFTYARPLNGMIVGLGLLLAMEALIVKIWGPNPVVVKSPVTGNLEIGGVSLAYSRLIAIGIAAIAAAGFTYWLTRTRMGKQIRAAQENQLAAQHVGINVGRVVSLAFIVGSGAAGAAGAVLGSLHPISAFDGGDVVLKGFAVALLGGLGNVPGAMIASLFYGVGETMVAGYWLPQWVPLFTFGIIIVVLLIKPTGIGRSVVADNPEDADQGEALRAYAAAARSGPWLRWLKLGLAIILPIIAYPLMPSARLQEVLTLVAMYSIPAYSLSLLYHQTGMLSIAQAGFLGLGAYAGALLSIHAHWGFWASIVPCVGVGVLAGLLLGIPVARAFGHYFILLTFAFGSLVIVVIENWKSVTQGDSGLILTNTAPGSLGPISFTTPSSIYYLTVAFAALAFLCVLFISRSKFGQRLLAIRDNEELAGSLGLRVNTAKVFAFGLSGGLAALGGLLYVYQQGVVVPDSFTVLASIQFVIAVVIGGRTRSGPVVGLLVVLFLPEVVGLSPLDRQLVYGLILAVVVIVLPAGVVPSVSRAFWAGLGAIQGMRVTPVQSPAVAGEIGAAHNAERLGDPEKVAK